MCLRDGVLASLAGLPLPSAAGGGKGPRVAAGQSSPCAGCDGATPVKVTLIVAEAAHWPRTRR